MADVNHPVVGMINLRLKEAREDEGLTQVAWHERLTCDDYRVSLSTVRNYEDATSVPGQPSRMPPADYMARVAEVFGIRFEWLLLGQEPMKEDGVPAEEAQELDFLKGLFGEKARDVLASVTWLKTHQLRFAYLRLLDECRRASTVREESVEELPDLLGALFTFPFELPGRDQWIALPDALTPRERSLVAMHMTALVHLLFVPFRQSDEAFHLSQRLRSRGRGGQPDITGGSDAT